MQFDFNTVLSKAESALHEKRYEEALEMCDSIIEQHPGRFEPLEIRAQAHYKLRHIDSAMHDLARLIDMMPGNASPYFRRGRWRLNEQLFHEAIDDFSAAIRLDNGYYGEVLFYYRAEAYLKIKAFDKVALDCEKLSSDFFWGPKKRTKQDILRDASLSN